MKKIPKQAYTIEFKELAVKRVQAGEPVAVVVKELGLGDQTVRNWIRAAAVTHAEMKAASFEYIEVFYNRTRQHSTLGYRSPMQYLDHWQSEANQKMMAA
ncbi:MAG: IS3 family transposase [Pseudomonadota bacterium]